MKPKVLNVVHISTFTSGGAGTAACRIHEGLSENGVSSTFLSLGLPPKTNNGSYIQFGKIQYSFIRRAINKLIKIFQNNSTIRVLNLFYYQKRINEISDLLNCEWTSIPFSAHNILNHDAVKNADIVQLHWVAGMLDYPNFFKNNKKPVVWTLHDMNPFQGIFHYKEDEIRNEKVAASLNREIVEIKRKSIKNRNTNLAIVAPSKWLLAEASKSEIFNGVPACCIGYPLNTETFCLKEVNKIRERLKIPTQNTVLLFVSQAVSLHRKGFSLLVEALNTIQNRNLSLLVIGQPAELQIPDLQVLYLGSLDDNNLLCEYYCLADAFVIPSREDNLPNVMLESIACGTPVLSFDIGGMAEIIQNGFNGLKANKLDVFELAKIITEFTETKEDYNKAAIRNFALQNFSNRDIAEKYIELYKSLLQ